MSAIVNTNYWSALWNFKGNLFLDQDEAESLTMHFFQLGICIKNAMQFKIQGLIRVNPYNSETDPEDLRLLN